MSAAISKLYPLFNQIIVDNGLNCKLTGGVDSCDEHGNVIQSLSLKITDRYFNGQQSNPILPLPTLDPIVIGQVKMFLKQFDPALEGFRVVGVHGLRIHDPKDRNHMYGRWQIQYVQEE